MGCNGIEALLRCTKATFEACDMVHIGANQWVRTNGHERHDGNCRKHTRQYASHVPEHANNTLRGTRTKHG